MTKLIALASLFLSTTVFAHGTAFSCDYSYHDQHVAISLGGEAAASQTFVISKDRECGDVSRRFAG